MEHLMTLMALVVAVTAGAQGTTIHEYPWNPDFNNDTYIGSEDLMGLLSTYGTQFGLPPEPCDYDGTPFEDFISGVWNEDIVIDSIFVQYELENIVEYFQAGCPDGVTDTVIFANAFVTGSGTFSTIGGLHIAYGGSDSYDGGNSLRIKFNGAEGSYQFRMYSSTINSLGFSNDGVFGTATHPWTSQYQLPFPEGWYMDEGGIHLEVGWDATQWPFYANYLHILPYWHYAE